MPSSLQVQWLMKFSVAPLSRSAVCSAVIRTVCTGTESFIVFNLLMYILRIHIALNQADGFGHFKNPDPSQEHIGLAVLHNPQSSFS
jgi:hypothetical protein